MNAGLIFGRGISFPPRVSADGRVAWSEGETNVRESIRLILMTEQPERLRTAEFRRQPGPISVRAEHGRNAPLDSGSNHQRTRVMGAAN